MKQWMLCLLTLSLLLTACASSPVEETTIATVPTTSATEPEPVPSETVAQPVPVLDLTQQEQELLLKLGMAERGQTQCVTCIALVMCTVLNRVNEPNRFGSSVSSVIYAQDQFTPVSDGSFDKTEPNEVCREALDMVICGWDESQGALYYEFCQGPSWHSQNLPLLFSHCDTRFYAG